MPRLRLKDLVTPTPGATIDSNEKASSSPSSRGHSGGSALSSRIDDPHRRTGQIPRKVTSGTPSSSPDVNASEIMQNKIMNDDDKEWYAKLFQKMHKKFLKPRSSVHNGFDVGLNASFVRQGEGILEAEGLDHRSSSYGVFIPVPVEIVRQLEVLYPAMEKRKEVDDSPPHVTVLFVGSLNDEQAVILRKTLDLALKTIEPFELKINGTSHFNNEEASVFHVKIESKGLTDLHNLLKASLESMGIPIGHRYGDGDDIYKGHITLAYLPPGQQEAEISVGGSWIVDRVEVWNMGSPVSFKLGNKPCLGCSAGLCKAHLVEGKKKKKKLLMEPDDIDVKKKKPKKKEVNTVAAGGVRGYTLPLGASNKKSAKEHKKRAAISARAFGGGKVV